jgi:hypothetical protein
MPYLVFDAADWARTGYATWMTGAGDMITVESSDLPPELPFGLDETPLLRESLAATAADRGGTLVECDVVTLAGLPAIRQVSKTPMPDRPGIAVTGAFTVPRATCTAVLKVQSMEERPSGVRETTLLQRHLEERPAGRRTAEHMRHWNTGALDPLPRGSLPRHPCDEPEWDLQFPRHPLSRVRGLMRELAGIVRPAPELVASLPFGAPSLETPPPDPGPRRPWYRRR